ncbi:MAG: TIR domain-containing protein [Opitutaceae bacterium]|jgi:tetratricopeptide (TPR) repeat protein
MSGAVFLSYASQDAEAAKRVCDSLRAGGIEVWFDTEGGLEHGDEWDAKIRRQIKDCVLFIPLISANTQARQEGYFRIEWELAAERAMGIAHGVPFILPVVIDDTREPDALVPDRFRKVQWMRLPGGAASPDVQARFLKIWSHRTGAPSHKAEPSEPAVIRPSSALQPAGRPGRWKYAWMAVATLGVAGALSWLLHAGRKNPVAPASAAAAAVPAAQAPTSEARQLEVKARTLFETIDATRDDYALAAELLKRAIEKDGEDAEVWAAEAQLDVLFAVRGWDRSDARRNSAQTEARRALRLDPQSFEVRMAQAALLADTGSEGAEKERLLRQLRKERPDDKRILRALATNIDRLGRVDESTALEDESAALPGGDPLALYSKSLNLWFVGRTAEAETAMRASVAQKPFAGALLMTVWYQTVLHGDLDGAEATLARISPAELEEDRGAFFGFYVAYLRRDVNQAIARLHALPRDWITDNWYRGPRDTLIGNALHLGGREDAAVTLWRQALKLVESRLATEPTNANLLYNRISLLAKLGEREDAERQFTVLVQMVGVNPASAAPVPAWETELCVLLGRKADAIRQVSSGLKLERHAVDYTAAILRLDPDWDALRGDPAFAQLIAEAKAREQSDTGPSAR